MRQYSICLYNLLIAKINSADRSLLIQLILTLSIDVGSGILVATAAFFKARTGEAFKQKRQELVEKLTWAVTLTRRDALFRRQKLLAGECHVCSNISLINLMRSLTLVFLKTRQSDRMETLLEDRPSIHEADRSRATWFVGFHDLNGVILMKPSPCHYFKFWSVVKLRTTRCYLTNLA